MELADAFEANGDTIAAIESTGACCVGSLATPGGTELTTPSQTTERPSPWLATSICRVPQTACATMLDGLTRTTARSAWA